MTARSRSGAAAVECAICLPLVLLITFGSIEAANGIYLKQILTQAAYEGAQVASRPGSSVTDAVAFAQQVLDSRRIRNATIDIQPAVSATTPSGTQVTVRIAAPANSNAFAMLWYLKNVSLRASVVMVRN